jgi:hypothetical protein
MEYNIKKCIMKISYLLLCMLFMTVHPRNIKKRLISPSPLELMKQDSELVIYSKKYKQALNNKNSQIAYVKKIAKDSNNRIIVVVQHKQKKTNLRGYVNMK